MPSRFLTNPSLPGSSDRPPSSASSDFPRGDAMAAGSSSSSSSSSPSRYAEVWNYMWIPLLISFSKELALAKAQSGILLPGQLENEAASAGGAVVPACPAPDPKLNFRPVIGILSHPGDGASGRLNNASGASYIAASYVKFVESAGARVIPLIYNEPPEVLFEKLNMVNGVLFTGGWAKSGLYYETAKAIFKKVLAKNDAGDHFPLYAVCLGFELLTMIISKKDTSVCSWLDLAHLTDYHLHKVMASIGTKLESINRHCKVEIAIALSLMSKDKNILEEFNAADQASTLQFIRNTNIEGTVFQRFPPDLLKKLSTDCLVMQNHHYGISPERLMQNTDLMNFFKVLTTSTDGDNKVYISTVQAHSYPVTAFQWHPEKNAFEWGLSMIPHSDDAIQVTQHVANFFVSEARKSINRASARKVLDNLIYNYSPTYCGKAGKGYDEVYIFTKRRSPHFSRA